MKTYNVLTGADHDQSVFLLGHAIGKRLERFEALIVVVSDLMMLPTMLHGAVGQKAPHKALAVCLGVSDVDDHIAHFKRVCDDMEPNIHILYWMPQHIKHKQDSDGWLPVEITSDTIMRQIKNPDVKCVTMFVE